MDIQINDIFGELQRIVSTVQKIEIPKVTQLVDTAEIAFAHSQCEMLNFANVFCAVANVV